MTRVDSKTAFPPIVTIKRFWRTGAVVNIAIAENKEHRVLEVIPFVDFKVVKAFYLSTPLLFSKFFFDSEYEGLATPPNDSDDAEKAFQSLAIEYIKLRLVIPLEGTLAVSLKALPTDKTKGNGELDTICSIPPLLEDLKSSAFGDSQSSERTWKFWATSVQKTEEISKGKEKTKADLQSSNNVEKVIKARTPSMIASLWRSAFRRIVLLNQIDRTRSRWKSMSVACNPPRRQSSFSSGYERARHSDICGSIATYGGSGGEDSDQESFFLDSPNGALVSQDPLSWDQVFTHIGEPCQKSLKAPHKWAMDETAPSDIKLGNTTLFNKSQIRKTRYSLQPILASLGMEHAKPEFGSSQRSIAIQPGTTGRRTSRNLNKSGDIDAFAERPKARFSLKLLTLRGDCNDDPVFPMQTSPNQNSSDSEALDLSPKPELDSCEKNFWLESKLNSEAAYGLPQLPRHRSSLTPLEWKAKVKIDQLSEKLPEQFLSRGFRPQYDFSITTDNPARRVRPTRRSLGQIKDLSSKSSLKESRRRSSGYVAENGTYYRQHLGLDIARQTMLMNYTKNGMLSSRRREVAASIPEEFITCEKDGDSAEQDCSSFFSSSSQDLFVSIDAQENNSAFEDETLTSNVHASTNVPKRRSINGGKLFSKCDALRRVHHSSESQLFGTLSSPLMSP